MAQGLGKEGRGAGRWRIWRVLENLEGLKRRIYRTMEHGTHFDRQPSGMRDTVDRAHSVERTATCITGGYHIVFHAFPFVQMDRMKSVRRVGLLLRRTLQAERPTSRKTRIQKLCFKDAGCAGFLSAYRSKVWVVCWRRKGRACR